MEQIIEQQATETEAPETIEFGGVTWTRVEREEGVDYETVINGDRARVHQYPDGDWLWHRYIKVLKDVRSSGMDDDLSAILATRDEAMQACFDAPMKMVEAMKTVLMAIGEDLDSIKYQHGFRDGQAVIRLEILKTLGVPQLPDED